MGDQVMDSETAAEVLNELAEGLRISIEAEDAVVAAFDWYRGQWEASRDEGSVPISLTRRIRQLQESRGNIRRWKRELDAYGTAIAILRAYRATKTEGS